MAQLLVVEDDPLVLKHWEPALVGRGWTVHIASTLAETEAVLDRLVGIALDAVLLDRMVPDGDATTLVPRIRNSHPKAGVAIVSSYVDAELSLSFQFRGVYVLPKPVKVPVLCQLVEVLVAETCDAVDDYARAVELSASQRLVLRFAVAGMGRKEVAACLDCSEGTVATQWQRIFDKTKERSQRDVLAAVIRFSRRNSSS